MERSQYFLVFCTLVVASHCSYSKKELIMGNWLSKQPVIALHFDSKTVTEIYGYDTILSQYYISKDTLFIMGDNAQSKHKIQVLNHEFLELVPFSVEKDILILNEVKFRKQ